ncbi:PACE efflux transporter [Ferrimonas sp. SCSIO 43195]|uniref:PACE efflux transporter n=1 Tax=Ferrimonas sp. SCSIO 43195 TaxID=2822844 RepID=UPI002075C3AE|nr:PACE efflux transporter [Ferrimonas sp. SCSIO 43195]USD36598.1 PACE efflux transporter [Ferrimonas sp. SCSIO 43195]
MSTKERIFHSLMFELIALVIVINLGSLVTGAGHSMTWAAIAMSLLAMAWNYVYNLMFDRCFGSNRETRTPMIRLGHGLGFEVGFMAVSLPMLMWILQMGFWQVLMLDIGFVLFFLVYAIAFNWIYDTLRLRMLGPIQAKTA